MAEVGKRTSKRTQVGRDVYETSEGEMVSEKSTTFKHKGEWVNVPTIFDGRSYDDDTLRMMLDAEVIKPTSTHTNKEDAIKAASERSESLRFNEGGMADYRKRLIDMTDEERAAVAPGAPQFSEDYENVDDPLSVQMMEAGLDFTPVGTAKGISDIKDELSRDDPNYLKAIGMGAVEAAALIPGAAPVLKGMVKGSLGNTKKIITSKKDLGFDMGEPYDYDLTLKMEDIIDEWASGDISNPKLRKKLGELDITLGNRIGPKADPSTLEIQMPDGRVFYGTGDVPSTPRPKSLDLPPAENAARTQIAGTLPTYKKADSLLTELSGEGKTLDFGAGLGLSKKELGFDTYEPFPKEGFKPDFNNPSEIPSNAYKKITNLNVLNVVPKDVRDTIVKDIGRILEPGGRAVITTRGRDVMDAKGKPGPEEMSIITTRNTYQKGFTQPELKTYIQETLGESFDVVNNKLGAAGVTVHKLPTKGYAEGGAVMDKQMEMAFGDAGERVDPVSGNDVPIGSMPEEVRDDIPAQLSEGEYVVPADVVRFFGVKFFEDIRNEAKRGFADMEANGRIGGEPVPAMGMAIIEPQDDLDIMFEDSDFEVVDGYAEGGVVDYSAALGVLSDSGFQGNTGMESREYVNSTGNIINILFFNGMPMSAIPQGYTYVDPKPAPVSTGGAVTTAADDDNGPDIDIDPPEALNYKELSASELQAMVQDQKSVTGDAIGLGAAVINPFFGIAVKAAMWHQRKQVEKEITRRMNDETIGESERGQYADLLEISMEDSPGMWTRLFGTEEEKDSKGVGKLPFDPVSAEPEAITNALEEAIEYTGQDPIPDPEPIEVTSLNDEPGARDYKGPLADIAPMLIDDPYVPDPEVPAVPDSGSNFLASEDAVIAEQRREKIKERMAQKKAQSQRKIDALGARISAKDSLARAAADKGDDNDSHKTMMKAAATKQRNKASGLGAQTKKGSTAGSKSGYFD